MEQEISERFGSVSEFEDHYNFDMAHLFSDISPYGEEFNKIKERNIDITPDMLLEIKMTDPNDMKQYKKLISDLKHHNDRKRFCYVQTPGIFEALNDQFGIENHLMYLILYPEKLKELYQRQVDWNIKFAENAIELGADGIQVSDDWGSQRSLLFSYDMFRDMIYPFHKQITEAIKKRNVLISLHSDGCIVPALDSIAELGYDFIHPWQENANMPYELYLNKYQNKFGILGGICVQSTLGFENYTKLENEIRRVFGILKGKRWACCTTHFVQNHCSVDELIYAI